jgi:hypothetical protein
MSYLAIGLVTQAIAELLEKKLNKPPLLGATTLQVATLPPDDDRVDRENGVNLFLYRVSESPFAMNVNWRGDRVSPGLNRPPVPLTLHYMMTAYSKKGAGTVRDDVTSHQILGNAIAILHEHPVLNDVHDSDFDADLDTQFAPELRNAFEKIKVTHTAISMEEFSKIWTGFSKAYRLSVAYEVSLVQVAPLVPAAMPGPPVQDLRLAVETLAAPIITAIEPEAGPASAEIVLKGSAFTAQGKTTIVNAGEFEIEEADLIRVSDREIAFRLPPALQRGPRQLITVTVGGIESAPASYEVRPWISAIQPLRGITGVPLTIPFELPAGATVSAEFDRQPAPAAVSPDGKLVRIIVPDITANGHKPVALIVNDGADRRSNERLFEVLPVIESVAVSSAGTPVKTTVTVTGRRLKGQSVQVRYGRILISKGENLSETQVTAEVTRALPADQQVSVIVDGRESPSWPPRLDRIEPAQAAPGSEVSLFGGGLTGEDVIVRFGATDARIGGHAYASRIVVTVPAGLPAGGVKVKASVDGDETNELNFEVQL